jgi:superfamily II DNA or RNA helicase
MNNGMSYTDINLKSKVLRRASSSDDFALYVAALEWGLIDPIVIEDRDDLKSEYRWRDRVSPYHHQVTNLITFCRRLPVTLLADDVGLGKTISAGLIASELISRGRLSKILIVCPKILREQWKEELESKFDIPAVVVSGRELILAKPPGDAGAVITTYQSARMYLDKMEKIGYEMLILDEAHKLRNLYGVDPAPQVAVCFRKALSDRMFKYVLMLTATPIQNRLWDLYSLVDLLTVARGHKNPFGSEGAFASRFLADNKGQARKLNPEAKDEFRSIVYGYMSRIRRGDANLHFPERVVKLYTVDPTPEEKELILAIAEPIKKLNFLSQIIVLQALISSPQALVKVLGGMAEKGTATAELSAIAKEVAKRIPITAKLSGLGALVDQLSQEKPCDWRIVVFTRWRETQTAIQDFFEKKGITCGLINGDSGARNQETIARFKKDVPEIHAIISTEAGSEGVNLQAANVLVNFDLPWNPMIVEQRIGRIQRLSSNFENVSIFNVVLRGTFEEYIVGRLMEKLQMASNAIGDIEALLEASGIDEDENGANGFEEIIRQLVVASLSGKDVQQATVKAEQSIQNAKIQLDQEKANINTLLGRMDGSEYAGPKCPKLPSPVRSMDVRSFVLQALKTLGSDVVIDGDTCLLTSGVHREIIRFDNSKYEGEMASTIYAPGTPAFERLVSDVADQDLHMIEDVDDNVVNGAEEMARRWADSFGATLHGSTIDGVWRCFEGSAHVRVRATVSCDSYERLVRVSCSHGEHRVEGDRYNLEPINEIIETPRAVGVEAARLNERSRMDQGISEFCRFYDERRIQELQAASGDVRKSKKIEDDFTPRVDATLVALNGVVCRQLRVTVSYRLDTDDKYESTITVMPHGDVVISAPDLVTCDKSGRTVPEQCIKKCEISGLRVISHLLVQSELSQRNALPEHVVICALSGKRILSDEADISSVTGRYITKSLLNASALSGLMAEPEFLGQCSFSNTQVLTSELETSQISGKKYRIDEQLRSNVSGKTGHRNEFVFCSVTGASLLPSEAETCAATGKIVMPGVLERCEVSGNKVLPSELEKCAITGKMALKKYFVSSSISGARFLDTEAVRSATGKFCLPLEARKCEWSGAMRHPDDLRTCLLTGLLVGFEYVSTNGESRLDTLAGLLNGVTRSAVATEKWPVMASSLSSALGGGRCTIESAVLSPDNQRLAACAEVLTWMGLRKKLCGFVFSSSEGSIVGRIASGKRDDDGWHRVG